MSWLTDFTSKAENLLNKFDETAAKTFNESSTDSVFVSNAVRKSEECLPSSREQKVTTTITVAKPYEKNTPDSHQTLIKPPSTPQSSINERATKEQVSTNVPRPTTTAEANKKKEDLLFEFLNSNAPPVTMKGHIQNLSGPKTSTPRKNLSTEILPDVQVETEPKISIQNPEQTVQSKVEDKVDGLSLTDDSRSKTSLENTNVNRPQFSNLELENKLLKNELQSLHEEMSSVAGRLKEQQQETEKYRLRYENRRSQQNDDYERIRSEYENKITDLKEQLNAKDSQLAVLRVRIQEVDSALKEKTTQLEQIQQQNEILFQDQSQASGVQETVVRNLREKLTETENHLQKEKLENQSIKDELVNLQTKVQEEQKQYAHSVKELQMKQSEEKNKYREMESKVKIAEDSAENAQKELKDYKDKAARILQAKEKLIVSLRQGSDSSDLPPALLSELEETKQERDILRDELQQNNYRLEQLRSEYLDLELSHKTDSDDNQEKIEALQSSLQEEVEKRRTAEEDMKRYIQELHFSREELHSMKKSQLTQNQENESTIKRLKNQINVKQSISTTQEELENRIRTLTDSLIHKQTVVETLSTEKNSLVLQLERLEKQYKDVQNSLLKRNKSPNLHDVEDPEGISTANSMTSIMPDQIKRNARWRTTVNEIDKFSIRLGVFLRRYPIARLMVIFYVCLLHVWVTFVLLTYTPEIHNEHNSSSHSK